MSKLKNIGRGRHLELVDTDGWEFARRIRGVGVVGIVALTASDEVVLVEQHRPPMAARVLELPAGLVGDDPGTSPETSVDAARRELREETGFTSKAWTEVGILSSSAGLTDERVTMFVARDVVKTDPGGGVDSERIEVHLVPRTMLSNVVADRLRVGEFVDGKVLAVETMLSMAASTG